LGFASSHSGRLEDESPEGLVTEGLVTEGVVTESGRLEDFSGSVTVSAVSDGSESAEVDSLYSSSS
jgi:hypothetical protein